MLLLFDITDIAVPFYATKPFVFRAGVFRGGIASSSFCKFVFVKCVRFRGGESCVCETRRVD